MKILLFLVLIPFAVIAGTEKEKVLSLKQRGEIVWAGTFASEDGFIYDYRACTGYKTPTLYTFRLKGIHYSE